MARFRTSKFNAEDTEIEEAEPGAEPAEPEQERPTFVPLTTGTRVFYVIAQEGMIKQARKDKSVPEGAKVVEKVPMARLTDECVVAALIRGELTEPINVADHWNADALLVEPSGFLRELGKVCSPLVVRLRGDWLSLVWA